VDIPHIALIGLRRAVVMHRNLSSPERPPIRCDHCRKPFGLILHRYFRMRFCSSDCLKAYQQRLDKLTRVKIERLDLSHAFSDETSEAA
jgi:hypothetical protein